MDLINKIRQTGLRYSFAIAFNRIVPEWLFRCRRYVIYQLDPSLAQSNSDSTVEVQYCGDEEQILAIERLTYVSREIAHDGNKAESSIKLRSIEATIDGELAGGFWSSAGQFQETELGVRYLLANDQVWLFGAYVDKTQRGKGVYSEILRFAVREEAKTGRTQALVAVNPDNHRSNRVHQRHATQVIGKVFCIRFLKSSLCLSKGKINRDRMFSFNSTTNPILIRFEQEVAN